MVDGAALEKRSPRKWSVGSNPTLSATRINSLRYQGKLWRGAGVDYQARLESACPSEGPWVRIPPSPLGITSPDSPNFVLELARVEK